MSDVMIDLETLGNKEDCVVVSIGVVVFDIDKKTILDSYYSALNVDNQMKKGRTVVADTLQWWMKQADAAKKVFSEDAKDPKLALQEIWAMLDKYRPLTVWGNGSGFDVNIVENMYDMYHEKLPWFYTNVNDFRTFARFVGKKEKLVKKAINHNALDDAKAQVEYIFKHYNPATGAVETPAEVQITPKEEIVGDYPDIDGISDVVLEHISVEANNHVHEVVNANTTKQGKKMVYDAYKTGAQIWAAKFESNSKKMWDLVNAFRQADQKLVGKELTEELLQQSMTDTRTALQAILGDKGLHDE
jgi:hypothetical protein